MKNSHRSAMVLGWCMAFVVASALDHECVLSAIYVASGLLSWTGMWFSLQAERIREGRR